MRLSYGASWVAQAYSGEPHHLTRMIEAAIAHRGFSYLHVLSPCVTFDKTSKTYQNLDMSVQLLPDDHDASDFSAALAAAQNNEHPQIGLYFKSERPTLADGMNDVGERAAASD